MWRTVSIGGACVLLLASLLALAPSSTAQTMQPHVTVRTVSDPNLPNGRLAPEVGEARPEVRVMVSLPPGTFCVQPIRVDLRVIGLPSYATMVLNPASHAVNPHGGLPASAQAYSFEVRSLAHVTVNRNAPAVESGWYDVEATASGVSLTNACNIGYGKSVATFGIQNEYWPFLVVAPPPIVEGREGSLPFSVTNLGNGPTRVTMQLEARPGDFEWLSPRSPFRLGTSPPEDSADGRESVVAASYGAVRAGLVPYVATFLAEYHGVLPGGAATDTVVVKGFVLVPETTGTPAAASQEAASGVAWLGALAAAGTVAALRRRY